MADGGALNRSEEESVTKTTCPYCGVGCGVEVRYQPDSVPALVQGDPQHPANFGKLCAKGLALGDTVSPKGRLLHPLIKGQRASWDDATDLIANRFLDIIKNHGPDAVAFYVSGQILTEDYYVANKLMKGFIGSANIDTNSRLCMASSVAGHKRAFGADTVPGTYQDLELADLIILTGSNLAWCHPILFQRIMAEKEKRPSLKLVVIDPRKTASCDFADLHLPIQSGGDVALFLGLLKHLDDLGLKDRAYVSAYTKGSALALERAAGFDLDRVALDTGLDRSDLEVFFTLVAGTEKTVTIYSQGVNQAVDGTDKVNAIINCHLLTGRIGKPGMGPFSVTGQPNAMGGREVGGLANQLACHMALENAGDRDIAQRFWQSPTIADKPGLKAVDLFDAVHDGRVKAVWIMATNPVVSLPNADHVRAALQKCDFVVVSDVIADTDTGACADIVLPSTSWGEKQGTVTNSERRISRQRRFKSPPGEALDDWKQFARVGQKMGFQKAFEYQSVADVFREYAAMTAFENEGRRDLDLSGLMTLSDADYASLAPIQWPVKAEEDGVSALNGQEKRFFANGGFFTPDRLGVFVPVAAAEHTGVAGDHLYTLNSGRVRDQWHTMTRTGISANLFRHIAEPYVEIAPQDAEKLGLQDADIAELSAPSGRALLRVLITDRQQPGSLFAPMHWTGEYSAQGRIGPLIAPLVDPVSGQPALKAATVKVAPFPGQCYGFAVLGLDDRAAKPLLEPFEYWAIAGVSPADTLDSRAACRMEWASTNPCKLEDFVEAATSALSPVFGAIETVVLDAGQKGQSACALYHGDCLVGVIYLAPRLVSASRSFAAAQIFQSFSKSGRAAPLAGYPGGDIPDKGPIICSCMNVGQNEIAAAISAGALDLKSVGDKTAAGTSCGSCRSEISRLLSTHVKLAS